MLLASCLVVTPGPSVIATTGLNHRLTVGMDRGMNMIEEMLKHAEKSSLETYIKKKQIQVIIRECRHCSTHPTQLQEEIQIDEKLEQNFISQILIRSNCEVKSRSEKKVEQIKFE